MDRSDVAERKLGRRQALMWEKYDFSRGRGLEIGPLHQTIAPREYADVRYLDVFDRDQLIANYADEPDVPRVAPRGRLRPVRRRQGALDPGDHRDSDDASTG